MIFILEHTEHKYLMFKMWLLLLSIFGMVNFAVLGSYVVCHCWIVHGLSSLAFNLPMSSCLERYPEDFCFENQFPDVARRHCTFERNESSTSCSTTTILSLSCSPFFQRSRRSKDVVTE